MFESVYPTTRTARLVLRVAARYMQRQAAKRTITIHRPNEDITVEGDVKGGTVRIMEVIDEDGKKVSLSPKERQEAERRLKDPSQDETGR